MKHDSVPISEKRTALAGNIAERLISLALVMATLPDPVLRVMVAYIAFAGDNAEAWWSLPEVARIIGRSRSTTSAAITQAELLKLLETDPATKMGGTGKSARRRMMLPYRSARDLKPSENPNGSESRHKAPGIPDKSARNPERKQHHEHQQEHQHHHDDGKSGNGLNGEARKMLVEAGVKGINLKRILTSPGMTIETITGAISDSAGTDNPGGFIAQRLLNPNSPRVSREETHKQKLMEALS